MISQEECIPVSPFPMFESEDCICSPSTFNPPLRWKVAGDLVGLLGDELEGTLRRIRP